MQTIFLILSFVYLYSKCRDITAGWGTTGWLLTAGMVLFLLRWVLNTEREWAQLGCGAGALFMVFAWFIGLSLLDIYSAGPSITTPPGLPPPPPQPPLTQPVAPVTWVACAVQAALSVWLAWILARDVGSRRRVAG